MDTEISIIHLLDYKEVLLFFYQKRLQNDPTYSQRKYALDLNISISTLSELLNRKHVPSIKSTRKIAASLKLSQIESEHLVDLTLLESPYNQILRDEALKRIKKRQRQFSFTN